MKIGYLAKTLDPRSGGGRYALSVIEEVKRLGHEVVVLKEVDDGFEGSAVLKKGRGFISSLRATRRLLKDCEIVHAFDVWPHAVYAYWGVLGTSKKFFVSGVGTYSVAPLEGGLKKLILRKVLNRASKILCISRYVEQEMRRRLPLQNTIVVHLGFTPLPKITDKERHEFGKGYNISPESTPVLLTVGAIKDRKGQYDTLCAVEILAKTYPSILYVMVGESDERAYVARIKDFVRTHKLERNVQIVSDANTDQALAYFYDRADVFVMNSNNSYGHFEGFGLVFLEAAAFGKPVVGSRDCGIEDALKDGFNGYLTEQRAHIDIANKIDEALRGRGALGENSLEFVKKFSWQKTALQYIEWYGKSLNGIVKP